MDRSQILGRMRDHVYRRAELHAARYSDPEGFLKHFQVNMSDLRDSIDGGPAVAETAMNHREPISLGAEIEALAAFRMLASLTHRAQCACVPCLARRAY